MPDIVREIPSAPSTIEELQRYVEQEFISLRQDLYSLINDDASFNTGITGDLAGDVVGNVTGSVVVPNTGTVGQAAGPLLTFDDTNNYLEIAGCKVGIGTTGPRALLDFGAQQITQVLLLGEGVGNVRTGFGLDSADASMRIFVPNVENNSIKFGTISISDGSTWSQKMVIHNNGNVGIGTATPGSKLAAVGLPIYANNAAAITGGLAAGDFYRTNANPDPVNVVH